MNVENPSSCLAQLSGGHVAVKQLPVSLGVGQASQRGASDLRPTQGLAAVALGRRGEVLVSRPGLLRQGFGLSQGHTLDLPVTVALASSLLC